MSSLLNFYNNFSHWITAFWNLTALMTETWNQRFSTKYLTNYPVNIYLFKFNNTNTRKGCEISSELITEALEIGSKYCSGVLMVNFNEFHTFFHCFCCWIWACICLLRETFLWKENHQLFCIMNQKLLLEALTKKRDSKERVPTPTPYPLPLPIWR